MHWIDPVVLAKVRSVQKLQDVEVVTSAYLPVGQIVQLLDWVLGAYLPASQSVHVVEPAVLYVPVGQTLLQSVCPVCAW